MGWIYNPNPIPVHFLEPKKWEHVEREGNDHSLWEAQDWENGLGMLPVQPRGGGQNGVAMHPLISLAPGRSWLCEMELPCRLTHSLAQG